MDLVGLVLFSLSSQRTLLPPRLLLMAVAMLLLRQNVIIRAGKEKGRERSRRGRAIHYIEASPCGKKRV
jgi:hypothetical protein